MFKPDFAALVLKETQPELGKKGGTATKKKETKTGNVSKKGTKPGADKPTPLPTSRESLIEKIHMQANKARTIVAPINDPDGDEEEEEADIIVSADE